MGATIISSAEGLTIEPEIIIDTDRDGITAIQFSAFGAFGAVNGAYALGQDLSGIPGIPSGKFTIVRRNVEHIVGGESGLYRIRVSGEGGVENQQLFTSETSYSQQYQKVDGIINLPLAQVPTKYDLIWLYPSATITTNSSSDSPQRAEALARSLVSNMQVQIVKDRPADRNISGPSLGSSPNIDKIYITGSSVEVAGGLYRIRATASKGFVVIE